MLKCHDCKYYFYDDSTGYSECTKADDFTDDEFEIYESGEFLENCQHFEQSEDIDFPIIPN